MDKLKAFFKRIPQEKRTEMYILKGKEICTRSNFEKLNTKTMTEIEGVAKKLFDSVAQSGSFLKLKEGKGMEEAIRLSFVLNLTKDPEFMGQLSKNIDLNTQSLSQLKQLKETFEEKKQFEDYPETVKVVLGHLRDLPANATVKELITLIGASPDFRDRIDKFNDITTGGLENLVGNLQVIKRQMRRQEVIDSLTSKYESHFVDEWKEMEVNGEIDFETWIKPETDRADYFAEKYALRLKNPLISKEFIKQCLPDNLERVIDIDRFTREFQKEEKSKILFKEIQLKPEEFQQFLKDIPIPLKASNFEKIREFYIFYVENFNKNRAAITGIMEGLHGSSVLMRNLEAYLPKVEELIKYGMDFTVKPGYPADMVGKAMAAVIDRNNDIETYVKKGTVYGHNITDEFEAQFQKEVFRTFVKEISGLDDGVLSLHMNYYKDLKYPVTRENLTWAVSVSTFMKNYMDEGFAFYDVNALLLQQIPFINKPKLEELQNLPQNLKLIALQLHPPEIKPDKILNEIQGHPVAVIGAIIDKFLAPLLPKEEMKKAGVIHAGFLKLDELVSQLPQEAAVPEGEAAPLTAASAVAKMRQLVTANRPLAETLLPIALADTPKAVQQLLQLTLATIQGNLEVPPKEGGLPQLKNLVALLMTNAKELKTDPTKSFFVDLPISIDAQKEIRNNLKRINALKYLDNFIGKKVIQKFLERSAIIKKLFPSESQEKVSQIVAPMAASFAAALPSLIQKFQVEKYLDYLGQVGKFKEGSLSEQDLERKTWEFLEVLVTDFSQFSDKSLPDAFNVVRMLGAEGK